MKIARCHECGIDVEIIEVNGVARARCNQAEMCRLCRSLRGVTIEVALGAPLCEALEDLLLDES